MIESMILTSYSDKSYLVASLDRYVVSISITSRDRLKRQMRQKFLLRDKFVLLRNMSFMLRWGLRYYMTGKQVDAAIAPPTTGQG